MNTIFEIVEKKGGRAFSVGMLTATIVSFVCFYFNLDIYLSFSSIRIFGDIAWLVLFFFLPFYGGVFGYAYISYWFSKRKDKQRQ